MNVSDFLDAPLQWEMLKCNAIDMLVPNMRQPVRTLVQLLNDPKVNDSGHDWGVFETWRNPIRQAYLLKEGTTKTLFSAHNVGMAVDIVPKSRTTGHFFWEDDGHGVLAQWQDLDKFATAQPMLRKPIAWDRPHVEHRDWPRVRGYLAR